MLRIHSFLVPNHITSIIKCISFGAILSMVTAKMCTKQLLWTLFGAFLKHFQTFFDKFDTFRDSVQGETTSKTPLAWWKARLASSKITSFWAIWRCLSKFVQTKGFQMSFVVAEDWFSLKRLWFWMPRWKNAHFICSIWLKCWPQVPWPFARKETLKRPIWHVFCLTTWIFGVWVHFSLSRLAIS